MRAAARQPGAYRSGQAALRAHQRRRLQIPDQPMTFNRRIIHRLPPRCAALPCCAALLGFAPDGSAAAGDLSPPTRRFHLGERPAEPVGKGPSRVAPRGAPAPSPPRHLPQNRAHLARRTGAVHSRLPSRPIVQLWSAASCRLPGVANGRLRRASTQPPTGPAHLGRSRNTSGSDHKSACAARCASIRSNGNAEDSSVGKLCSSCNG